MYKKYELTDDIKVINGITLKRIRSLIDFNDVSIGDFGGFVESEINLSHKGDCWLYNNASSYNNATVCGNSKLLDDVIVTDNVKINGDITIIKDAYLNGKVNIYTTNTFLGKLITIENLFDYVVTVLNDTISIGCLVYKRDAWEQAYLNKEHIHLSKDEDNYKKGLEVVRLVNKIF